MSTTSGDGIPTDSPSSSGGTGKGFAAQKYVWAFLIALLVLDAALLIFGPHLRQHAEDIKAALAAGKRPDWWDDAAVGIHYAAWINAILLIALLVTSKWWTRPASQITNHKLQISNPRWFWPLTIVAIVTCVALRYPLASKSLWWDEAWVIQQVSHGKWKVDSKKPDALKFQAHDWTRCAWYYQKPTNHVPMSLLQKASITTWQKLTGAKRERFTDLAARVPALLASCVAVGLMACLLRAWGRPGAGVVAAFVLAMHPWAIRYGVDARAYAFVIPLCISGMFAITRIVASRGGKVWDWVWWGLTEFLWLWAFPNAVIDIAALNILCAWLLWRSVEKADRGTVLMRLVVTNVFAAMCFIQMFLPNVMQARRWAGQEADKHVLDARVVMELLTSLFPLTPGPVPADASPLRLRLGAVTFALWLIVMLRYAASGVEKNHRLILSSLAASTISFAAITWMLGSYYYPRFAIGCLPVLIASACATKFSESRYPHALALLCMFITMVVVVRFPDLMTKPIAPLHDVATYVQSHEKSPKPLIACYGLGREVMLVYEPSCVPVENAVGVEALMQRAKAEQRPLYVIYGYNSFNRSLLADGFKLLDDRSLFLEVKAYPGIEPEFYFRVLKAN